jgi:signal transduction histidine kinase
MQALGGLAVLVLGVCAVTLVTPAAYRSDGGFVPGLVMGVLVWAAGRVAAGRANRAQQLRAVSDELARTRDAELRAAADEQRSALARDLHDVGAHALTAVCLQAAAAQTWWERDRVRACSALESVRRLTEETLDPLSRSLAQPARGRAVEPLDPAALDELAGLSRLLGLKIDLAVTGRPRQVPDEVAHVAYRVLQEALTNAARHAGGTSVRIRLAYAEDGLEVRISDTGRAVGRPVLAVPVRGGGWGLRGMRERVEALRGELTAGPVGAGFEVLARLPA